MTGWEQASDYFHKRMKKSKQEKFLEQLDKVIDILKCKCKIISCTEASCAGCNAKAHINCSCPKDIKVPILELEFVLAQRTKVGDFSSLQIAGNDAKETKRQNKQLARKLQEKTRLEKHKDKNVVNDANEALSDEGGGDAEKEKYTEDEEFELLKKTPNKKNNMTKIPNIALASVRYGVEDRPTAAIVTATLQDYGIITEEDCSQVVDPSKIRRWKTKVMVEHQCSGEIENQEDKVMCLFFDGRRDSTKMMLFNEETGKFYQSKSMEEHYSITVEPDGRYVDHFVPEPATKTTSHAKQIAIYIVKWLKEHSADDTILAIGGDSTNTNTGWKGGVISYVEEMLGRKLIWLVCNLHTNELPMRALVENLIDQTESSTGFSGTIGKALDKVNEMPTNYQFRPITIGEDLVELPEEVVEDLSTDQMHAYKLCQAIRSGNMSVDLALMKCGPIDHSRWLTTANRTVKLWTSEHGLDGEDLEDL